MSETRISIATDCSENVTVYARACDLQEQVALNPMQYFSVINGLLSTSIWLVNSMVIMSTSWKSLNYYNFFLLLFPLLLFFGYNQSIQNALPPLTYKHCQHVAKKRTCLNRLI